MFTPSELKPLKKTRTHSEPPCQRKPTALPLPLPTSVPSECFFPMRHRWWKCALSAILKRWGWGVSYVAILWYIMIYYGVNRRILESSFNIDLTANKPSFYCYRLYTRKSVSSLKRKVEPFPIPMVRWSKSEAALGCVFIYIFFFFFFCLFQFLFIKCFSKKSWWGCFINFHKCSTPVKLCLFCC